jgi:hypothetical protein
MAGHSLLIIRRRKNPRNNGRLFSEPLLSGPDSFGARERLFPYFANTSVFYLLDRRDVQTCLMLLDKMRHVMERNAENLDFIGF